MRSIYRAQIPILENVTVRRIDDKKPPKISSHSAEAMRKEADDTVLFFFFLALPSEAQPAGSA
jgi:hypothetical protein